MINIYANCERKLNRQSNCKDNCLHMYTWKHSYISTHTHAYYIHTNSQINYIHVCIPYWKIWYLCSLHGYLFSQVICHIKTGWHNFVILCRIHALFILLLPTFQTKTSEAKMSGNKENLSFCLPWIWNAYETYT